MKNSKRKVSFIQVKNDSKSKVTSLIITLGLFLVITLNFVPHPLEPLQSLGALDTEELGVWRKVVLS